MKDRRWGSRRRLNCRPNREHPRQRRSHQIWCGAQKAIPYLHRGPDRPRKALNCFYSVLMLMLFFEEDTRAWGPRTSPGAWISCPRHCKAPVWASFSAQNSARQAALRVACIDGPLRRQGKRAPANLVGDAGSREKGDPLHWTKRAGGASTTGKGPQLVQASGLVRAEACASGKGVCAVGVFPSERPVRMELAVGSWPAKRQSGRGDDGINRRTLAEDREG